MRAAGRPQQVRGGDDQGQRPPAGGVRAGQLAGRLERAGDLGAAPGQVGRLARPAPSPAGQQQVPVQDQGPADSPGVYGRAVHRRSSSQTAVRRDGRARSPSVAPQRRSSARTGPRKGTSTRPRPNSSATRAASTPVAPSRAHACASRSRRPPSPAARPGRRRPGRAPSRARGRRPAGRPRRGAPACSAVSRASIPLLEDPAQHLARRQPGDLVHQHHPARPLVGGQRARRPGRSSSAGSTARPGSGRTAATTASPSAGSGTPNTAQSATAG